MYRLELTVKEYALRERVDERTVWRWIVKRKIKIRRTPGGSIRIPVIAVPVLPNPPNGTDK